LVNSPEKTTAITPIPPITKRANLRNPCLQLIRTNIWQRDWLAAWLVGGVVGGLFVSLLLGAGITPLSDQDSWTTWGYNSRALFVAGSITRFLAEQGQNELNHPSYPPGQPLLTTWAYVALGGIDERLGKLLMPFWYLALMGLVWTELRRRIRPWPAAGLTLLLATTPFLLDHAMLGNADLPFTVTMTLAALGLLRWVEQGAWRWLLAGGLALGMAAWIKLDGFYLGVALLTIGGLVRSVHLRQVRLAGWWTTWMGVLVALLLLVGLQVAWQHLTQRAGIVSETPSSAMLMVNGWENGRRGLTVIASELLFSHNNSTWSLLGAGFHLLWVVCLGAVGLAGLRRWRAPGLLLFGLGVAAIVAFYGLIYVLRPYFSMERYLFHAAPLAILAAGYAFKDG
jgi:4-amino-4-deoxy-L-arabinose transferase-like glycosyltransferase